MLKELKNKLKITWDDEDENLLNSIEAGKASINSMVGFKINYDEDIEAKELLLNYCRYSYNNAVEYFEGNFESVILRLQLNYAVLKNEKNE